MRPTLTLLLVAALAAAGCDETPTQPTTPSTPVTVSQTFADTLPAGGAAFYSFVVLQASPVSLMFGSLTPAGTDTPLSIPMAIGIGVPQGTGCNVPSPVDIAPGLTYQASQTLGIGTYCLNIADAGGNLAGPADFAIRIVANPPDSEPGEPGTSVFRSDLTVGGAATRTFPATKAGVVVLRLESLGPPSNVEASIGIGLPRDDGTGACNVTSAIVTSAPAEVSVPVAAGIFCAKIADVGQFTGIVTFSMNIVRP